MKIIVCSALCLFLTFSVCAQNTTIPKSNKTEAPAPWFDKVNNFSNEVFNSLVEIRRDLHAHPELSGQEKRTAGIVKQYLQKLGIEVISDVGGHGVVGVIRGDKEGKSIAWRADMDAIPGSFPYDTAFKSVVEGVQHGCGHDVHTVIGLGIASVLSKFKSSLAGTVYLLFQPAEETFLGAQAMIEDGALDVADLDEIYAVHITPFPTGVIATKSQEMYAYQKGVKIVFGGMLDEKDIEKIVNKLTQDLTRTTHGGDPRQIELFANSENGDLTSKNTIFQDYSFITRFYTGSENSKTILQAEIYETNRSNLDKLLAKIEHTIVKTEYKDQFVSVEFTMENPTVFNDALLIEEATAYLRTLYGDNNVLSLQGQLPYFNDDFSYFQQKIPGVYFFLGASDFENNIVAMPHSPIFSVDEESIKVGVKYFSSLILERLKGTE